MDKISHQLSRPHNNDYSQHGLYNYLPAVAGSKINNMCPICSNRQQKKLLTVEKFTLWQCGHCQLLRLTPVVHGIGDDYKSVLNLDVYLSYMRHFHQKQYRQELKEITRLIPKGNLLDVGCGAGWFLKVAQNFGFLASGLEPQKTLAEIARKENPTSNVYNFEIEKLKKFTKIYQVVTFWSVLEHLTSPVGTIKNFSGAISKGGILAIRTPNASGLFQKLSILLFKLSFGKCVFPLSLILQLEFNSKHWFVFSLKSLQILLEKSGFNVRVVKYSTSMDWQDLDRWLLARHKKVSPVLIAVFKIVFAISDIVTRLTNTQDDMVILAQKL